MKISLRFACPLVFLTFFLLIFASCSSPEQNFKQGNYQQVINQISDLKDPTEDDYLLKARSYIAMGQDGKALESLFIYLSITDGRNQEGRAFAVENFIALNKSDRLTILVLLPTDGLQAQKALYAAHSRLGNKDTASDILNQLSLSLGFVEYVTLMIDAPNDIGYMVDIFTAWYSAISETDKDSYLSLLQRFTTEVSIPENQAKRLFSLTDLLMTDSYYIDNALNLSCLLKIKGNILDMLYDRVNARIYWTQALRLNPNDQELKEKLER